MRRLVCVMGPTASGKTRLGVELAKRLRGEIVSADSMQIYRGMDIATATPDLAERQGIPHHMMDIADVTQPYSAAQYAEAASACVEDIFARGLQPIVVGGTGFWFDALEGRVQFEDEPDGAEVRAQLQAFAEHNGAAALHERLAAVDPERAAQLHENDVKRVIRALEIYELTGQTMTQRNQAAAAAPLRYETVKIGLNTDREVLYERIDRRVDVMVEQGLLEEARAMWQRGLGSTAVQAIGYKELFAYFAGAIPLEQALEDIKRESRRYAKRQLTWFRRDPAIHWLDCGSPETLVQQAVELLRRENFEVEDFV